MMPYCPSSFEGHWCILTVDHVDHQDAPHKCIHGLTWQVIAI